MERGAVDIIERSGGCATGGIGGGQGRRRLGISGEGLGLVGFIGGLEVAIRLISERIGDEINLQFFHWLAETLMVSQLILGAIWLGIGSWPLAVRLGATWLNVAAWIIVFFEPGWELVSFRVTEISFIALHVCLAAAPLWFGRLFGMGLRTSREHRRECNGADGEGAGTWQFSIRELFSWTAAFAVLAWFAGSQNLVDLLREVIGFRPRTWYLFVTPTLTALAILWPGRRAVAWAWGAVNLATPFVFESGAERWRTVSALAFTQGALGFLRWRGYRLRFEWVWRRRVREERPRER